VSVPSNIAEGKGHHSDREFLHFLFHARGSLLELETQLTLAQELQYFSDEILASLLSDTAALGSSLTGLINSLEHPGSRDESRRPTTEDRRHV
jgi:four helix bundle protein